MAAPKKAQALARQLFKLSLEQGRLSADRVAAVLAYVEKSKPAHPLAVLQVYQRLIAREVARSQVVIEHAGPVNPALLDQISASLSRRYDRPVTWVSKPNTALLAGLRARIGDDVYETSVSGQLSTLAANA
ncbi:F0F1 ATP synthase subunit delta [Nibricoccus sp. IMCC34717]|uniref:F0F1 ATP synthase subunit delta n=1 Tax=Nibricoccus sp. IMCC34717 TaxID=3034021 RepID=UPI00384C7B6F